IYMQFIHGESGDSSLFCFLMRIDEYAQLEGSTCRLIPPKEPYFVASHTHDPPIVDTSSSNGECNNSQSGHKIVLKNTSNYIEHRNRDNWLNYSKTLWTFSLLMIAFLVLLWTTAMLFLSVIWIRSTQQKMGVPPKCLTMLSSVIGTIEVINGGIEIALGFTAPSVLFNLLTILARDPFNQTRKRWNLILAKFYHPPSEITYTVGKLFDLNLGRFLETMSWSMSFLLLASRYWYH
ncbi:hypothetical protein GZH46_03002, partial [Fragariocoptes setiger]